LASAVQQTATTKATPGSTARSNGHSNTKSLLKLHLNPKLSLPGGPRPAGTALGLGAKGWQPYAWSPPPGHVQAGPGRPQACGPELWSTVEETALARRPEPREMYRKKASSWEQASQVPFEASSTPKIFGSGRSHTRRNLALRPGACLPGPYGRGGQKSMNLSSIAIFNICRTVSILSPAQSN